MMHQFYFQLIANQLQISIKQVAATISLLDETCTTPFIARYRKEFTGGLDEVQIEHIKLLSQKFKDLIKRKETILNVIREQDKLSAQLQEMIDACWDSNELEDIYLPYKPKRKTRASAAREKGLEPLAMWLLKENNGSVNNETQRFVKNGVANIDEALQGARDIIADIINEDTIARSLIRHQFQKFAVLKTKILKAKELEGQKYSDYFTYEEALNRCPSHRVLAVLRGEEEGFLKVSIEPDEAIAIQKLIYKYKRRNTESSAHIELAITDAYKRLLKPAIENETRQLAKAKADEEAIAVFANNVRQLLLSAPLGSQRILAIDPGFKSGCKVVCLNEEGMLIADEVIYPHEPQNAKRQAVEALTILVNTHHIQAIAIGNGTAGRETEEWIRSINFGNEIPLFMVNENGASVYSASAIAREEFPDKDITVRGAVSIGRRLADPLAELVKIDAKAIGVGQYQHDVDQNKLKQQLDIVVQSCVNLVGVNLNTASKSLLTYVSGLSEQTAKSIIQYRAEKGAFKSRNELKKVPKIGPKTFEQSAAFLRIPNAKNPLDNSAVHPESYGIVELMASKNNCAVSDLIHHENLRNTIQPNDYVTPLAGLPTITDILLELSKPGRDPREAILVFRFSDAKKPEELHVGTVIPGIVTNITKFGCFVDVGVKQDGMVHISQLANQYVSDPNTVVKLQQHVMVKVLEVDIVRKRIGLSMKF